MKSILLIGVILIMLYGGWRGYAKFSGVPPQVILGQHIYALEVADTDEKRRIGLGNRDGLCERCAMLFDFGVPGQYAFWMKGMRFPLDIAWLEENKIVWIERRVSPESALTYEPDVVSDRVLEFNAGALDGIQIGERVSFSSAW